MKKSTCDVIGIGSPLIDQIIQISDDYLLSLPAEKGSMVFVDYPTLQHILQKAKGHPLKQIGGSATNVIQGLAHLGHKCGLMGSIGIDGKGLEKELQAVGICNFYTYSKMPTGQVLCLVTPDGERTFRVFSGASQDIDPLELDRQAFNGISLVHIEGYSLARPGLAEAAMHLAKQAKALVSFDLANFEITRQYKDQILTLLNTYVDIVFANAREAQMLFGTSPKETAQKLARLCKTAIVTMNVDGCWIAQNGALIYSEAFPVKPLDSTGAGDLFASGFLHGYLSGNELSTCARFGALIAAEVVQVQGASLPQATWQHLKKILK